MPALIQLLLALACLAASSYQAAAQGRALNSGKWHQRNQDSQQAVSVHGGRTTVAAGTQRHRQADPNWQGPALTGPVYPLLQLEGQLPNIGDGSNGPQCLAHGHNTPVNLPGYSWMSSAEVRRKALVNRGDMSRLRVAMDRFRKLPPNENLTVTFLGASITAGQGAVDGKAFPWWAEEILHGALGRNVNIRNGAVPGTLSSYMSVCHNVHVPKDSDIIFVEYAVNDDYQQLPPMDNPVRRAFERLLRKLLTYPRKPAVILVHSYVWHRVSIPSGLYWTSSERDFHEFAVYYGIPELSVRAAVWNLMHEGVYGFMVDKTRGNHNGGKRSPTEDADTKGRVFYWDVFHPDGNTGHKFMGEMTSQSLMDALASVKNEPVTEAEKTAAAAQLPPPMLPHNWQSLSDRCFVGYLFREVVTEHNGWEYKDEGKDALKPKLGFVSHTPGAVLRIKVSTLTGSDKKDLPVTVELSHLKSYVQMGKASVTCESGCTCEHTQFNGFHEEKNTQLYLHEFKATQHENCVIAIQVLQDSQTGHHKVKIAGIVISEEGGEGGVKNYGAVQMAIEGSSQGGKAGTFDIRDWGRKV